MIATRFTPASNKPFFEIAYIQSGITPVMTSSAGLKSSRFQSIPISRRPTACGCSCSGPCSRRRTLAAPACCVIGTAQPNHGDDTWTWTTGARRLRRLNEAINSSATGTQTWDPDHYSGFNPKTEQYDYKFLGEKEMLATVDAEHSPEIRCATDGGGSACPERWQMRHMYIVTAEPRRDVYGGQSAGAAIDSKTVIYMDSEMWFEPYIDTYDRRGELFRNHIYWLAYRDRPVPDAKVAIYPFKREFVVGAVSTDVQSSRGHHVLPARHRDARARMLVHQHGRGR